METLDWKSISLPLGIGNERSEVRASSLHCEQQSALIRSCFQETARPLLRRGALSSKCSISLQVDCCASIGSSSIRHRVTLIMDYLGCQCCDALCVEPASRTSLGLCYGRLWSSTTIMPQATLAIIPVPICVARTFQGILEIRPDCTYWLTIDHIDSKYRNNIPRTDIHSF